VQRIRDNAAILGGDDLDSALAALVAAVYGEDGDDDVTALAVRRDG
jgi:hypothetical protein